MEIVKAFLPLIIFLLIWFGIGIYYGKKVEKHKSCIKPDLARPENSLTLVRGVEQTNYLRKYIVIIDNEVAGSISSGETKRFEVGAGTHNIQVKIDWCKTKPLTFEITPGQNTYLCCGATYNDCRSLYKHAANPSGYIYIKKTDSTFKIDRQTAAAL